MKSYWALVLVLALCSGCDDREMPPVTDGGPASRPSPAVGSGAARPRTLTEARRGFVTKAVPEPADGEPAPEPPPEVFRLVRYDAEVGKLPAYLTPDPGDGKKHPAIVWITGGDPNTLGEVWEPAPRENDQTAAAYREAGIVMMFPSLRGGNDNPGPREGFLGEVDDVIAAAEFLAREPYVDPRRIYLGGHSTGGTLAMLVAESTDRFRAAFAFGPVDDVRGYVPKLLAIDSDDFEEFAMRSPGFWLDSVRIPLFVLEGAEAPSNLGSLEATARARTNPHVRFFPVPGLDHFSVLAPANELIAAKILDDVGPRTGISITPEECASLAGKR